MTALAVCTGLVTDAEGTQDGGCARRKIHQAKQVKSTQSTLQTFPDHHHIAELKCAGHDTADLFTAMAAQKHSTDNEILL